MSENLNELSETELAALIEDAQVALKSRQKGKRKEVIAQIKELAASIGVQVEITEAGQGKASPRRGAKVAVKYRDPSNPSLEWTGRGMKPVWLREYLGQGRGLEEFAV